MRTKMYGDKQNCSYCIPAVSGEENYPVKSGKDAVGAWSNTLEKPLEDSLPTRSRENQSLTQALLAHHEPAHRSYCSAAPATVSPATTPSCRPAHPFQPAHYCGCQDEPSPSCPTGRNAGTPQGGREAASMGSKLGGSDAASCCSHLSAPGHSLGILLSHMLCPWTPPEQALRKRSQTL